VESILVADDRSSVAPNGRVSGSRFSRLRISGRYRLVSARQFEWDSATPSECRRLRTYWRNVQPLLEIFCSASRD